MNNKFLYVNKISFTADRTLEIFFQGCTIKCKGCHNPELQLKSNHFKMHIDEIFKKIKPFLKIAKHIHILGGEPLQQNINVLSLLLMNIRNFTDLCEEKPKIYLFTGYDVDYLNKMNIHDLKSICFYVDFIKIGRYIQDDLPVITNGMTLASSNQIIVDSLNFLYNGV